MKCSVIVACYNNPDLILETLGSIEKQTYQNWELVLVEDCSTDNTLEVLRQYISSKLSQEKYKLIPLPENGGVSNAKGTGVQNSNGEIIVICDHDDALAPDALEEIVRVHQKFPNASIVYSQHYNCDSQLQPLETEPSSKQVNYSDILEDKISHLLTYKRSSYELTPGYDPFFKIADDKDIIYKLEEVGEAIFVEKSLYYFRISSRGASQGYLNFNKSREEKLVAIQNAVARREVSGVKQLQPEALKQLLSEIHLLQAEGVLFSEQPLDAKFLKHLMKSILLNPSGNIKRKLKAAFLLSRLKRTLLRLLK